MAEDFPVGTAEGFGFSADVMSADCPSRLILQHMTSRWAALVMIALTEGGRLRFSQLKRRIGGVTENNQGFQFFTHIGMRNPDASDVENVWMFH